MESKSRNALIAGGIAFALVLVVGIGWAVQSNRDSTGEEGATPGEPASATEDPSATASTDPTDEPSASDSTDQPSPSAGSSSGNDLRVELADEYGLGVGDPNAPVKVEIFEDFLCPFCAQFEEQSSAKLIEAARNGDVYVVYRPMAFLSDYSGRALNAFGVVLEESGGQVALEFHDRLFAQQPSEAGEMPDDQWLIDRAVEAGAQEVDVARGIETLTFGQWVVNGNDAASKRGVNSTPTVFVDGEVVEATTIEELVANTMAQVEAG